MRTERQRAGDGAEELVARRLEAVGWQLIARQVRVGRDELDIVAVDPGPPPALVVLEVRWRSSRAFGLAEESFDQAKRRRLTRAALRLIAGGVPGGGHLPRLPLRIDLVVVEPSDPPAPPKIRHHRHVLAG